MEKKIIAVRGQDVEFDDIEVSLGELKDFVEKLIEKYGKDAKIYEESFYAPYDSEESHRFYVLYERLETDDEVDARVAKENERQAALKEQRRKQYESLQKEFGNE